MKASEIFKQYIWLTDMLFRSGGISLQELNERWVRTDMSGGVPMTRATFNRHKVAIEEIFDLCIECRRKGGYFYYIENGEVLKDNRLQHWMLDSLSISNMLLESHSLKDRILLENIPSGREHLQPLINAMKQNRKVWMTYRKFGQQEAYRIPVEPYALKVFKQRWYLLANNYKAIAVYALDRMVSVEETDEPFVFPGGFDTEAFFRDCYGVFSGTHDKAQRIVIRAYPPFTDYLRTLPLHHSQHEVKRTPRYADFEYYIRPTFDFRQELLSQGDEVEVLRPASFRKEMQEMLSRMLGRYE